MVQVENNPWKYERVHTFTMGGSKTLQDLGFSLVVPYYNDESRFRMQWDNWSNYSEFIKRKIQIIVVDDCSKKPFVDNIVPSLRKRVDFNLTVYRILEDLKWNTPGALNLGVSQAPTEWVWIMDSDCCVRPEMMELAMKIRPENNWMYFFHRTRITSDEVKKSNERPLGCCILFQKKVFDISGPFDEDFVGSRSGGYGIFDNDFEFWAHHNGITRCRIKDVIIDEYMEDVIGPNIQTKTNVQRDTVVINKRLHYAKIRGECPRNKKMLRFPWEKVLSLERW